MEKKKYTVDIAGNRVSLVTDEPEDFVKLITDTVSEKLTDMTKNSFHVTPVDAAIVLAVDYLSGKLKAERRIRSLESQLELCEMKLNSLSDTPEAPPTATDKTLPETIGNTIRASVGTTESKIRALEKYLDLKKNEKLPQTTRNERIKYIESLLRGD